MTNSIKADPNNWVDWTKEKLVYVQETGLVHWRSIYGTGVGDKFSVSINSKGYVYSNCIIAGKRRALHYLVWVLTVGEEPKQELDHIDGNPTNNTISNLRDVGHRTNCHNRKAKGYSYHKASGKWKASIKIDYSDVHLGLFDTPELARVAYEAAKNLKGYYHRTASKD